MANNDDLNFQDTVRFVNWVNKINDTYKIFLFSTLNAIFLYVTLTTGKSIDPDAIKQLLDEIREKISDYYKEYKLMENEIEPQKQYPTIY